MDDLTDKDLQSITKFTLVDRTQKGYYIYGLRLSDIKLLKKFSNLRELDLSYVRPVQGNIPVWKKFAAKLHVMTIPKTPLLDLTPLRGLTNLEILDLSHTSVCNLEAIKDLINLCKIQLLYSNVSDLEPLRGLTNLEELSFFGTNISNIEPLKDLKNLHRLDLPCKNVLDFEALGELTGLERPDGWPRETLEAIQGHVAENSWGVRGHVYDQELRKVAESGLDSSF